MYAPGLGTPGRCTPRIIGYMTGCDGAADGEFIVINDCYVTVIWACFGRT